MGVRNQENCFFILDLGGRFPHKNSHVSSLEIETYFLDSWPLVSVLKSLLLLWIIDVLSLIFTFFLK